MVSFILLNKFLYVGNSAIFIVLNLYPLTYGLRMELTTETMTK